MNVLCILMNIVVKYGLLIDIFIDTCMYIGRASVLIYTKVISHCYYVCLTACVINWFVIHIKL